MRERNLVRLAIATALAATSCTARAPKVPPTPTPIPTPSLFHLRAFFRACIGPPDGICDSGDVAVPGINTSIRKEDGEVVISSPTNQFGETMIEGLFHSQKFDFNFPSTIEGALPSGEVIEFCGAPTNVVSRTVYSDGTQEIEVDGTYTKCPTSALPDKG